MGKQRILFFSQNGSTTPEFRKQLFDQGIEINEVRSFDEAQRELLSGKYQLLVDRKEALSDEPLKLLEFIKRNKLPVLVILSASRSKVEAAVKAVKSGAVDFVNSSNIGQQLADSILQNITSNVESPGEEGGDGMSGDGEVELIGQSPAMEEVRSAIELVANSTTAVLITGDSGTGKEVVARSIHLQSGRAGKPFVAINCAALPKDVIENELFGHERGAFTGALVKKAGCFEMANEGTLFFDEIAEMNPDTQAKLLRVLEHHSFRRLGGKEEVHVDVRMVGATNKKIAAALKSGEFRQDLYYRFSVIEIYLPPLRERKEDIPLLAQHFFAEFRNRYKKHNQSLSEGAVELLTENDWPGNVRELKNVLERLVVTCPDNVIGEEHLPQRITNKSPQSQHIKIPIGVTRDVAEKLVIEQTLASVGNNKSRAARILGISRKTLHNKLHHYNG
ncbi:MAG: sigma-54-dependent Fis family transcriptional regulator [Ignavibacteriales bacterium]|nr:sigma-54-dependent Fis family transcriptional regulator [Ignavibacteriales bacterium]